MVPFDLDVPDGGARVWLKLETLQPVGSFKVRGASHAVAQLSPGDMAEGVWTVSAGNAAQGVALAARAAGVPCSVLMIDRAPHAKRVAIQQLGARIVAASYDECWRVVEEHDETRLPGRFVHPFDDDDFISGNGTAGLEIVEDLPDVDAVVASVGGGGLLAGVATAMRALRPGIRIYAAEPVTAAPLKRSFERGAASVFEEWVPSFVDGSGGKSVNPNDVAAPPRARGRLDCRQSRRDRARHENRRPTGARHLRRSGSVRRWRPRSPAASAPVTSWRSCPAATSTCRRLRD